MSNSYLVRYSTCCSMLFLGGLLLSLAGCQSTNIFQKPGSTTYHCPPNSSGHGSSCDDECNRPYDFGPSAVPPPVGTYVNQWNGEMISSARQSRYLVNRHEWYSGGAELGPAGRNHVASIADTLRHNHHLVYIEAEEIIPDRDETLEEAYQRIDQLNNERRSNVVMSLQSHGIGHADDLVKVATTNSVGIYGVEAPQIFNRLTRGRGGLGGRGNANNNGSLNGGANGGGQGLGAGF